MAPTTSTDTVKSKSRIGTIHALTDELEKLDPKTVKEDDLREFFCSFNDWENELYRKFLVDWGLPFDRATPRWCGGENNSTMEPSPQSIAAYLRSTRRIFNSKIRELEKELRTLG